jgi:hypothetical protein
MESLTQTRRAWHSLAELVLAGPQYRAGGTIRLRVVPDGFATVVAPDLRVAGGYLMVGAAALPIDGSTPALLAAAAGVAVGAPDGLYHDGSGVAADEVLALDEAAAAVLADAFGRGDAALRAFAPDATPVLWPEHFDVGITVDKVNYGVSPGDGYLARPYAYVGPHGGPPAGEFWNAPFGAAKPVSEVPDLVAFFQAGRDLVAG